MIMLRRDVSLLGAVLLVAGCVDGDAPRTAAATVVEPPAQVSHRAQPALDALPAADEPARSVQELASTMIEDPDPEQRRESVYSIADAEGPDQAAVIGQALTDPDPKVRSAAVQAMTGVEDGTAADWLSIGLGDPDPAVRRTAVEALGQVGGTSARYLLEQALGDADAGVREAAQQMLEEPRFAAAAVR